MRPRRAGVAAAAAGRRRRRARGGRTGFSRFPVRAGRGLLRLPARQGHPRHRRRPGRRGAVPADPAAAAGAGHRPARRRARRAAPGRRAPRARGRRRAAPRPGWYASKTSSSTTWAPSATPPTRARSPPDPIRCVTVRSAVRTVAGRETRSARTRRERRRTGSRVRRFTGPAPRAQAARRGAPGARLPLHLLLVPARPAGAVAPRAGGRAARRRGVPRPARLRRAPTAGCASTRPRSPGSRRPPGSSAPCSPPPRPARPAGLLRPARVGDGVPLPDAPRHAAVPLRLGAAGTDAVVESLPVHCTHHDAFRFFTPAARRATPSRPPGPTRSSTSSPAACTPRWTSTSGPTSSPPPRPADLVADCFELAADVRELDMRASPYDLAALGYPPVPIETAGGPRRLRARPGRTSRCAPLPCASASSTSAPPSSDLSARSSWRICCR